MAKSKTKAATKRAPITKPGRAKAKMPAFTKPPSALVDVFRRAVVDLPDVQPRQMFGYPAAFTKSQMFASLFQDQVIVRLSEPDRQAAARDGAQPFEPMPGRPMREYVIVPDRVRESSSDLRAWLEKAHAYARSLPPKRKR